MLFGQEHVDRYQATGGEEGHDWQGTHALLLTTTGRKSGQKRTTPLIYAATGGKDEVVDYLIAQGAKVNAVSPNGTSALMMAVREGKGSTVTLLIARGADVNLKNENGATALAWAERGNEQAMAEALRKAGAKN